MPRQNRRRVPAASPVPFGGTGSTQQWRGEQHTVRTIAGAAAGKTYRCPGCDQEIRPSVAHLVVWRSDDLNAADRRHWHSACWQARDRRTPGVLRSRNAPRY